MSTAAPFRLALLAPRHWPAWAGLACIFLASRLPQNWLYALGAGLGRVLRSVARSRMRIARRNLELCFPELSAAERARLLDGNARDLGIMFAEFALAWMGSHAKLARIPVDVEGLAHLQALRAEGRGILLVGAHFSHLELAARLLTQSLPVAGMYRQHDDAAFEWAIKRARLRYADAMFGREELRATVKYLKRGGVVWYAPDQDMKGKDSVFVPFFGIPAATITATHHLARLSGAAVVPFFHQRRLDGSYALRIGQPLAQFPSADSTEDTARVSLQIEAMVREAPEQYLWVHKRFKSRPAGAAKLY